MRTSAGRLLTAILTLGFLDGAVYNLLPITFPAFRHEFGQGLEVLGRAQLVFFLSTLVFSAIGGWFVVSYGVRISAVGAVVGLAAGFAIIAVARRFSILLGGSFCFGLSLTAVEVVCSIVISDFFPDRRQSLFFLSGLLNAVGAMTGPALFGAWLQHSQASAFGWRTIYVALAGVMLGIAGMTAFLLPRTQLESPKRLEATIGSFAMLANVMKQPAMYGIGILIFLHGVAQVGMVSWVGHLYIRRFEIGAALAAFFISVNSGGFLLGRSLLGWITARWQISELLVLAICGAGGSLAFLATIVAKSYVAGLIAFAIAGLFISADGPSINSFVGCRFAGQTATAFSLVNGFGNLGSAAGPYSVGVLGNRFGIEKGIWLLPLFSTGLSIISLAWFAFTRVHRELPTVMDVKP